MTTTQKTNDVPILWCTCGDGMEHDPTDWLDGGIYGKSFHCLGCNKRVYLNEKLLNEKKDEAVVEALKAERERFVALFNSFKFTTLNKPEHE